jgi:hypothetical protein
VTVEFFQQPFHVEGLFFLGQRLLEDMHQLALNRAMVPSRPGFQCLGNVRRHVFD